MLKGSTPTVRGMLWMAAAGALFTLLNATMKKLALDIDPWLVGFLRYLLGGMFMLVPALRLGVRDAFKAAKAADLTAGSDI